MLKKEINTKLYYSISEIGEMFDVSNSLIRFWEAEFPILNPRKNTKGDRRFTQKDIDNFRIIYHLVKERGFTLEGANNEISQNKERLKKRFEILDNLQKVKKHLENQLENLG
jgi:DNA-binding transcriptional MerR regulator